MLQAGVPTIIPISIQTNTPLDAMQLEIKGLGDVTLEKVTVDPMYNAYFISNPGVGPVNEIRAMLQDINHDLAQVPTLYLHLTANTTIALKEVLQIDQSNFSSFLLHNTSKVSRLYFDFSGSVATENPIGQNLQILAAQPNPFIDRAQVTIALGQSESVLFEVMDVTGKLLFSEKTMLAAGKHNLTIPGDRIPQSGIVLYRISAGQDNTTGKIMKL